MPGPNPTETARNVENKWLSVCPQLFSTIVDYFSIFLIYNRLKFEIRNMKKKNC